MNRKRRTGIGELYLHPNEAGLQAIANAANVTHSSEYTASAGVHER
jgi:hypothetical protein